MSIFDSNACGFAECHEGLDATTFLRFLRLLRNVFSLVSILGVALLVINIVYNKTHDDGSKNTMAILTIQYVQGGWMWPALGVSYIISQFCALPVQCTT